ncbi:LysR family transcriptional regulator [Pantoea endophytica]|uniref:LysR family transcriptional regulator n=1 Tax=Pantoea endophytica TaxID=92488 RepID=UPI0024131D56|nr:LysR family transcriptional regulator [Pantoea endophytica]
MQDDDFRQREAFLAVVRAGSFSAGARALGRDVSIISRRIAALEKRLGIRLIERTARRIRPTEEGRRYRQILNWQTNCCVKPKRKRVLWQHVRRGPFA